MLAAMRRDILPVNVQRFALYAEGPQDEIAKLQAEIDEYTGRDILAELGGEEELLRVFSGARFDGVVPSWADLVAVQIERVEFGV